MRIRCVLALFASLSPFVLAGEPPCDGSSSAGLHVGIADNRLEAYWCGKAPGGSIGQADVKSFIQRPERRTLLLTFAEQKPGRELTVNVHGASIEVTVRWPAENRHASLTQDDNGVAFAIPGKEPVRAKTFHELVRQQTADVQVNLLRPLSELGAIFDPSPDLPVVMALAASGYSDPDPATLETVTKLTADLSAATASASADEAARDKAQAGLIRIFPLAIKHITDLAKNAANPEWKAHLDAVIAAHPGIASVRPYVEEHGLQNDRKYIEGLVNEVPLLREAARMRLKMLSQ